MISCYDYTLYEAHDECYSPKHDTNFVLLQLAKSVKSL